MGRQMDGWIDRWIDGWTDGRLDILTDKGKLLYLFR